MLIASLAHLGLPVPTQPRVVKHSARADMNASKKARTALRAKKRSAAEQHDSPNELVWLAPTAGGASAGIVAQHSGIMPVAVVLFTALSFVSFWRAAPIVSEAAKSLIDIHYGEAKLAGMLPPPDASRREGNTSYWPEAKVWAKKVWLSSAESRQIISEFGCRFRVFLQFSKQLQPAIG